MALGSTLGMAIGTGAGAYFGGPGGAALGAGLGGAVGGMFDSSGAGDAARAMQDQASRWRNYVEGQQQKAVDMVMTPSAIAAHDQALQSQEQNVRRQESLVASLDPNIIEAGKQTAQLLQGKSAPVLQNLQQQRQLQRDKMIDQLKNQMGPGAATSTAGQQALQQFDQQTANIMNGAQQEYLDKVSNMSLAGASTLGQTLSQVSTALNSINEAGPQNKAAQLIAQFTGAMAGPQQALMETAGGDFIDKQIQSQKMQGLSQSLIGAGAAMLGNSSLSDKGKTPNGTTPNAGTNYADYSQSGFTPEMMSQEASRQAAINAGGIYGPGGAPADTPAAPGTLGAAVRSPAVGRKAIGAPSYLPFSANYGGARDAAHDQAYNMSPYSSPYQPYQFNPNAYGNGGSMVAGGQ